MIVTLIGSTRFKGVFEQVAEHLTLAGHVVLTPSARWQCDGRAPSPEERVTLDRVYDQKIQISDRVIVLNVDGHLGASTLRDMSVSDSLGKPAMMLDWSTEQHEENHKALYFARQFLSSRTAVHAPPARPYQGA